MKFVLMMLTAFALPAIALSQTGESERVAYYSVGRAGTASYEQLSFRAENGKRASITYAYGKNSQEIDLTYLTHDKCNGEPCFMVRFPNNLTLQVIPKDRALKVVSDDGKYSKIFGWEYVGPINGVGTFCEACAEDEKDAIIILRRYFLR
jgi:hypothetical protein